MGLTGERRIGLQYWRQQSDVNAKIKKERGYPNESRTCFINIILPDGGGRIADGPNENMGRSMKLANGVLRLSLLLLLFPILLSVTNNKDRRWGGGVSSDAAISALNVSKLSNCWNCMPATSANDMVSSPSIIILEDAGPVCAAGGWTTSSPPALNDWSLPGDGGSMILTIGSP